MARHRIVVTASIIPPYLTPPHLQVVLAGDYPKPDALLEGVSGLLVVSPEQITLSGEGHVLQQHIVEEGIRMHTGVVSAETHWLIRWSFVHLVPKAVPTTILA